MSGGHGFGQRPGDPAPNKGLRYPAEPLTPGEVAALLDGCSRRAPTGIRNRALLTLLYRSGLRVSEVLALRPADVDLDARSVRLLDTKSGRAQTRGYHPTADDALARWLDARRALGIRGGRLFCTLAGQPVSDDYVRGLLRRLRARAGIAKRVHPHGLRHTFAVELERAGTPVTVISKLLGHSSVAVTARYLDHLTNGQAVEALAGAELPPIRHHHPASAAATPAREPVPMSTQVRKPAEEPAPPASRRQPARRREPRITLDTGYELVRAADHAETGAWLVVAGGTQAGRVSRAFEGTGTAVWQATSSAGVRARCAGKGATRGGNARTRDRAAAELMMMLARRGDSR